MARGLVSVADGEHVQARSVAAPTTRSVAASLFPEIELDHAPPEKGVTVHSGDMGQIKPGPRGNGAKPSIRAAPIGTSSIVSIRNPGGPSF